MADKEIHDDIQEINSSFDEIKALLKKFFFRFYLYLGYIALMTLAHVILIIYVLSK